VESVLRARYRPLERSDTRKSRAYPVDVPSSDRLRLKIGEAEAVVQTILNGRSTAAQPFLKRATA
jgi:hypothetical protein